MSEPLITLISQMIKINDYYLSIVVITLSLNSFYLNAESMDYTNK